jgi:hypothetical protein
LQYTTVDEIKQGKEPDPWSHDFTSTSYSNQSNN